MGLADSLKGFYESMEEKYYSLLDGIEDAGIPVYKVVDAIEAQNIPSFPLAIIFSLILIVLIGLAVNSIFFAGAALTINVQDSNGDAIRGASITATLDGENIGEAETNSGGKAEIVIPIGEEVQLTIEKDDYEETTRLFTAEESEEATTITLHKEITTLSKTINLLESGTARLIQGPVTIEFSCTGTDFTETKTTYDGSIDIDVPSDCDMLISNPVGNYIVSNDSISLASEDNFDLYLDELDGETGNVIVNVKNNSGDSLPGINVSLYIPTESNSPGTVFQTTQTTANGTATFDEVPLGRYYVGSYDITGNYAEYDGLADGLIQEVGEGSFTQFSIVMSDSTAGKIRLVVKDSQTLEAIENALVKLSKEETEIATKYTDSEGKIEFSVGEDVEYHIEIDKAGYLLTALDLVPSLDYTQVMLEQATAENSESLLVNIVDENNQPIENVRVKLKRNSDRTQVGAEIVTGLDGRAIFERVEEGRYFVYAIKPGYGEQTSEPITLDSRKENVLKLRIPIGLGRIEASVVDDQGNPVTDASIKVVDTFSNEVIQEQVTDSDGIKILNIRADKKVYLVVSSNDYVRTTTTPIQMQRDATIEKRITLQKSIEKFELKLEGLFVNDEAVSESTRALSSGQNYTAKLKLMIPTNTNFEEAGVHIRTGAEQNDIMEKDSLYISDVRAAYKSIQRGTSYNPPTGQSEDFQHITSGNSKWTNITFKNITGGIYEVEADIQIKDEAKIGSALEIWYRAYGKSGGYIRAPNDTVLGSAANSGEKEGLYANALKRSYSVGPSSLCGEEFCSSFSITDLREGLTTSIMDEYTAQIGSKYRFIFDLTSVSQTPFSASQLSIKDRSSGISIESYNIKTATGEQRKGSGVGSELSIALGEITKDSVITGEVVLNSIKEGSIPLEISIKSGSGNAVEIFKKTIIIKVLPAETLSIDVLPKVIVPLINNNLLVRVTNVSDGGEPTTISNAIVSIKKDNVVVASGQTDSEGVFAYTLLSPSDGSEIGILVEKTGYAPSEKQIRISSNILLSDPSVVKLTLAVGGTAFKTISAELLNATLIPLDIDNVKLSKDFEGYADIRFDEPKIGETIAPDSNSQLEGTVRLGEAGKNISQPLTLNGAINIRVTNSNFKQTWLASIPLELVLGFGNEVDDTECFNIFPGEWKIFGSTTSKKQLRVTVTNSCTVGGEKISLRNLSARIVTGNDNLLGTYQASTSIEGSQSVRLENEFRKLADSLNENAEETINLEFQPANIVSGMSEAKIEIRATHFTAQGEQKLIKKIDVLTNINNLSECVEIMTNREIVVQSCGYGTGYNNYGGGQFGSYNNSRFSQYDPYSSQFGYGTGNPPYIGSNFSQNSVFGDSYYDYQNATYPNSYYTQPFYGGSYGGSFGNPSMGSGFGNSYIGGGFGTVGVSQGIGNSWNCGEGGFSVRNNCASPIDLSFDPEPGINVAERTVTIEPGEETEIIVEPTNFFGRYELGVRAKPTESNEKAVDIRTLSINVVNEAAKNYRDCISVSPSRTLNFNNFFGKPVQLDIINSCYGEGVYLPLSNNTIYFGGTGIATPTDAGSGFREMIESWAYIDEKTVPSPNGKVTQVMSFELIKALKQYRNNAPEANFFEANQFANIGNLRYFVSSGYYTALGRTNLRVNFITPNSGQRTTSFPMIIKDYWPLLEYAENLQGQFTTYGDAKVLPKNCINKKALDFTHLGYLPPETYRTFENGRLFRIGEKNGCGSADSLQNVKPEVYTQNGLIMEVRPDPADPRHELVLIIKEPENWKRTQFRYTSTGRVVRVSPPGSDLVSLPIKINIEGQEGPQPDDGKTGEGIEFSCPDGKSGDIVYKNLGLQHIHYSWDQKTSDEFPVKEDACDAYTYTNENASRNDLYTTEDKAPWFCDAVQSTIEFGRKIKEIERKVPKNKIGTCTELSGTENKFICDKKENQNSVEIYRYKVPQKAGYFMNEEGDGVINLLDNDESTIARLVVELKEIYGTYGDIIKETNSDEKLTKLREGGNVLGIIDSTITNADKILKKMKEEEQFKGIDIVMVIDDWENVKSGDIRDLTYLNAIVIGDDKVIVTLENFIEFDKDIQEKCNMNTTKFCDLGTAESPNKLHTSYIKQLTEKGTWKVTVKNVPIIGDYAKDKVLIEHGLWEFYNKNVIPKMYLMEDDYTDGLIKEFNDHRAYSDVDITEFTGSVGKPGRYQTEVKYYWGTYENENTEITFDLDKDSEGIKDLEGITKEIKKEENGTKGVIYTENVLFEIPIDGEIKWGTGFRGTPEARKTLRFNAVGNRTIEPAAGSTLLENIEKYTKGTEDGKVMDISKTGFITSLSDPVIINVEVRKSKENAGFLYNFFKQGTPKIEIPWEITPSSDFGYSGSVSLESHAVSELCSKTDTNEYPGFVIDEEGGGTARYRSLIFVPATTTGYKFKLECIKQSGSITAVYSDGKEKNEERLGSISKAGNEIKISTEMNDVDNEQGPFNTRYNLQKLLNMVYTSQICVEASSTNMGLFWNDDTILKS